MHQFLFRVGMYILLVAALWTCFMATPRAVKVISQSRTAAYDAFLKEHGEERPNDLVSYTDRLVIFENSAEEVRRLNAQVNATWRAAVNRFSDYTPEELENLHGYRPIMHTLSAATAASSFVEEEEEDVGQSSAQLATTVDWSGADHILAPFQGHCGSCWAVAAVAAIELQAGLLGLAIRPLSYEQVVACTPNKMHCGGTGGCHGATVELAMQHISDYGVTGKEDYQGYQTGTDHQCHPHKPVRATIRGFRILPKNDQPALMRALATGGATTVAVAAKTWHHYWGGVFDNCARDAVISHAVVALGYGRDKQHNRDYWLIRNSWGPFWGEHGKIRLLRLPDSPEGSYCGMDHDPMKGVACPGGPPAVPVCGMCGVLFDSTQPYGVEVHW